jgi:putative DNA primase/helicase
VTLAEAIAAAGMMPPRRIVPDRWMRFPGVGKGSSNRSGWCRLITPTLAVFGDWSSGIAETWRDDAHRDDDRSRALLKEAQERERRFAKEQRDRQAIVAKQAALLVEQAIIGGHPYLIRKGFPNRATLIREEHIVIPVRDVDHYQQIISAQLISLEGEKRFLPGGRTRGGVHRIGTAGASKTVLCEGYATGLSIEAALRLLTSSYAVIVCFSAGNLALIADRFPGAVVAADNDVSRVGETAARRTNLKWIMPPQVGEDFNDLMIREGIHGTHAIKELLRKEFA